MPRFPGGTATLSTLEFSLSPCGPAPVGPAEDLDEVLVDFLPQPPGPLGPPFNSRHSLGWLCGLIERHHLKPEAEDAAEALE